MILIKIIYGAWIFFQLARNAKNPEQIFLNFLNKKARISLKNGLSFTTLQPLDVLSIYEIIFADDYRLKTLKQPVKKIVDIGAGLGDFSIYAATLYPKSKIISIEPNSTQYDLLTNNIKLNNVKNVKPYNFAVGKKKKYDLYIKKNNVHTSTIDKNDVIKKISVKGVSLEELINDKVDLLKIDCEGGEIDILNSATTFKMKYINKIVVEYHNHIIPNEDKKISEILSRNKFIIKRVPNMTSPNLGYIFATRI